jgi:hypothetical protein
MSSESAGPELPCSWQNLHERHRGDSRAARHGRATAVAYGWIIEPNDDLDGPIEVISGPDILADVVRAQLARGLGARFRLGERGLVYNEGRYVGPPTHGHCPLTEHGYSWSGATWIEVEINGHWVRLRVPVAATWRSRWRHRSYWFNTTLKNRIRR